MGRYEEISALERIIYLEKRTKELPGLIRNAEKESFRPVPTEPTRKIADKKPYPPVLLTDKMKLRAKLVPIPFSILVGLVCVFIFSHGVVLLSGHRSIGQYIHFRPIILVIITLIIIYAIAFALGMIPWIILHVKKTNRYRLNVRNSPEYKSQCEAVDEENRLAQKILDDQYEKERTHYYSVILPQYNQEKKTWNDTQTKKINSLKKEKQEVAAELIKLYSEYSYIPKDYRNIVILELLLDLLRKYDIPLAQAIAHIERERNQSSYHNYQQYNRGSRSNSSYNNPEPEFHYFAGCKNMKEAKARYRELMKKYHPDAGGNEEISKKINAEYDAIKKKFGYKTKK